MEFITSLWMPILLSAVFVFIISSVIHMFLGYHASDYDKVPNEDSAMDTLRGLNIPPGHYVLPKANSMKDYNTEEFKAKRAKGPVMFMHIMNPADGMGKSLMLWFLYCILVSLFAAYIGSHTVDPSAHYLGVFRIVGCAAFMGYGLGLLQSAIWGSSSWNGTLKSLFDALIYALVTGGTFGWLWG